MDVEVRDYVSLVERRANVPVRPLRDFAATAGLPMLAHVDEHDVTTFNERQTVRQIVPELERAAAEAPAVAADAARTILELTAMVRGEPHYLVFVGEHGA